MLFLLHDKPKFLTLIDEGGDSINIDEEGSKKCSIGAKDEHPLDNKQAKQKPWQNILVLSTRSGILKKKVWSMMQQMFSCI